MPAGAQPVGRRGRSSCHGLDTNSLTNKHSTCGFVLERAKGLAVQTAAWLATVAQLGSDVQWGETLVPVCLLHPSHLTKHALFNCLMLLFVKG